MNNSWIVNNYTAFLENHFPLYFQSLTEEQLTKLKELYFNVNDITLFCNWYSEYQVQPLNFSNLLKEYQSYISRLLLIIPINDKYLIDSLLRLLVEKKYRILYGFHHSNLLEQSIRKHPRSKMSVRLENKIANKVKLDGMYSEFSELIHHTVSSNTDLLNFRQLSNFDSKLIEYVSQQVEVLKTIFIEDLVVPNLRVMQLDLASKLQFQNQLKPQTAQILKDMGLI